MDKKVLLSTANSCVALSLKKESVDGGKVAKADVEEEIERKVNEEMMKEYPSLHLAGVKCPHHKSSPDPSSSNNESYLKEEILKMEKLKKENWKEFYGGQLRSRRFGMIGLPTCISNAEGKISLEWMRESLQAVRGREAFETYYSMSNKAHEDNTLRKQYSKKEASDLSKDPITLASVERIRHRAALKQYYQAVVAKVEDSFSQVTAEEKASYYHMHTSQGLKDVFEKGLLLDGSSVRQVGAGRLKDRLDFVHFKHGPFWPPDFGPLHPSPFHHCLSQAADEPFVEVNKEDDSSKEQFDSGVVFDSENSSKHVIQDLLCEDCLEFESRFESGNLSQATRTGAQEYELLLREDLYTSGHVQWFYFRVRNMVAGRKYCLRVVNLTKKNSLYGQGLQPLFYSEKEARAHSVGWKHTGTNIRYFKTKSFKPSRSHYTLNWQMIFPHDDDTCYFAHCYPYTYSRLQRDLLHLSSHKHLSIQQLCPSLAGNTCFLLTIAQPLPHCSEAGREDGRRVVLLTARVHPGETNSSHVMMGIINFLTSQQKLAQELRRAFVFKIIPMLNPDGVVVGNYRCSLAGVDLNRRFVQPSKQLHPCIYHLKQLINNHHKQIALYCDMHGHNQKKDVFMYGCPSNHDDLSAAHSMSSQEYLHTRVLPWLMAKQSPERFSFGSCDFEIAKSKRATGRSVLYHSFNLATSYTLEATFCGSSQLKVHFNEEDFRGVGKGLCHGLVSLGRAQTDHKYRDEIYAELREEVGKKKMSTKSSGAVRDGGVVREVGVVREDGVVRQDGVVREDAEGGSCGEDMRKATVQDDSENTSSNDEEEEPNRRLHVRLSKRLGAIKKKLSKKAKDHGGGGLKEGGKLKNDNFSFMGGAGRKRNSPKHRNSTNTFKHPTDNPYNPHPSQHKTRVDTKAKRFEGKYEGRSNNGIPCFVDLRICERAAKNKQPSMLLPPIVSDEAEDFKAKKTSSTETTKTLSILNFSNFITNILRK